MRTTRYPTFEELRALEFAARRARSRELLRLLKLGANAGTASCRTATRKESVMLKTPFWKQASRSLSRPVRQRQAANLEDAERVDRVLGAVVDAIRRIAHPH